MAPESGRTLARKGTRRASGAVTAGMAAECDGKFLNSLFAGGLACGVGLPAEAPRGGRLAHRRSFRAIAPTLKKANQPAETAKPEWMAASTFAFG